MQQPAGGRQEDPQEVTLIAVSKTKPVELIQEAIECGQVDFGENKVQELTGKYEILPKKSALAYDRSSSAQQG